MKSKFLLSIITILIIIPIIDYNVELKSFLWMLPVLFYNIFIIFTKREKINYSDVDIESGAIYKSFIINALIFIFVMVFLYEIKKINNKIIDLNTFIMIYYFLLVQNLELSSLGHKLMNIRKKATGFKEKLKILILNFLNLIIIYIILLSENITFIQKYERNLIEIILLVFIINIICRIVVFKNRSLFEEILKIDTVKNISKN